MTTPQVRPPAQPAQPAPSAQPPPDIEDQAPEAVIAAALAGIVAGAPVAAWASAVAVSLGVTVELAESLLVLAAGALAATQAVKPDAPEGGTADSPRAALRAAVRAQRRKASVAYVVRAARRVSASVATGATLSEALEAERRRYRLHADLQAARARAASEGTDAIAETGSALVRWKAHLDSRTCDSCRELDGTVFDLADFGSWPIGKQGYPVLPGANHVNDRCTMQSVNEPSELANPNAGVFHVKNSDRGGIMQTHNSSGRFDVKKPTTDMLEALAAGDWTRFVSLVTSDPDTRHRLMALQEGQRRKFTARWKAIWRKRGYSLGNPTNGKDEKGREVIDMARGDGITYVNDAPRNGNSNRRTETMGDRQAINQRATHYHNHGHDTEDAYDMARRDVLERGKDGIGRSREAAKRIGEGGDDIAAYVMGTMNGDLTNNDARAFGVDVPSGNELAEQYAEGYRDHKLSESEFVQRNRMRRQMGLESYDSNVLDNWYESYNVNDHDDDTVDQYGRQFGEYGLYVNGT